MAYSNFTLRQVKAEFGLTLYETTGLFDAIEPVELSPFLQQVLADHVPLALAINTEKAKSELIIANILVELKRRFPQQASLFSGIEFEVDKPRGLTGFCDFIISHSPEQLMLTAPVVAIVEAKNENLIGGLGQCIAEMLAAQLFNQQEQTPIELIYGAVTSGNAWRFLKLKQTQVEIDLKEYYIENAPHLMGILSAMVQQRA